MHMLVLGIRGDVTPNQTVTDSGLEQGCRAVLASRDEKRDTAQLWQRIRARHNVACAHAKIERDVESGCVLDVLRPSQCPGE